MIFIEGLEQFISPTMQEERGMEECDRTAGKVQDGLRKGGKRKEKKRTTEWKRCRG